MRIEINIESESSKERELINDLAERIAECLSYMYHELNHDRCPNKIIQYFIDILEGKDAE